MANGANATDSGSKRGHLAEGAALGKFLKPAKLGDMKLRIPDDAFVVELDGDFAMSLYAGDRVYRDRFAHLFQSRQSGSENDGNGSGAKARDTLNIRSASG